MLNLGCYRIIGAPCEVLDYRRSLEDFRRLPKISKQQQKFWEYFKEFEGLMRNFSEITNSIPNHLITETSFAVNWSSSLGHWTSMQLSIFESATLTTDQRLFNLLIL